MDADSTFSDLAVAAGVARSTVRTMLDEMVDLGIYFERDDGWYERDTMASILIGDA